MELRLLRILIFVISVTFAVVQGDNAAQSSSKDFTRKKWNMEDESTLSEIEGDQQEHEQNYLEDIDSDAFYEGESDELAEYPNSHPREEERTTSERKEINQVHIDHLDIGTKADSDESEEERPDMSEENTRKHQHINSEDDRYQEDAEDDEDIENDLQDYLVETDSFDTPTSRIPPREEISHPNYFKGRSYEMVDPEPLGEMERQLVDHVTVEIVAFVDSTFANQFDKKGEIDEYLSIYWNEVDIRFSSIKSIRIDVVLVGTALLDPVDEEEIFTVSNRNVNATKTLENFAVWVARQGAVPGHDISILMTSKKMAEKIEGLTYTGYVCQRYGSIVSFSVVVISDIGREFNTAGVAAHELGHSLGSSHDSRASSKMCSKGDGNIMTPIPNFYEEPSSYYFSGCSIDNIYKNLQSETTKCLRESATHVPTVPNVAKLPGDIPKVLDSFCTKWVTGSRSKFRAQRDCKKVFCSKTNRRGGRPKSKPILPPVGAPCGRSKKCILGECRGVREKI